MDDGRWMMDSSDDIHHPSSLFASRLYFKHIVPIRIAAARPSSRRRNGIRNRKEWAPEFGLSHVYALVGSPLVQRGLVHGQDHMTQGDGDWTHAHANLGEELGEETAAGFEGVIAANQRGAAESGDDDAEEGEGGGPEMADYDSSSYRATNSATNAFTFGSAPSSSTFCHAPPT